MIKKYNGVKSTNLDKWVIDFEDVINSRNNVNIYNLQDNIGDLKSELKRTYKILKNFKNEKRSAYNSKTKKIVKSINKQKTDKVNRYFSLIDDVIYNIETDWNDAHNYEKNLNIYNTVIKKTHKDTNDDNSLLIKKPADIEIDELKSSKILSWNSDIVKHVKKYESAKVDIKQYTRYVEDLPYSSIGNLLINIVDQATSISGIYNCLYNLWVAISTNKVSLLQMSLGNLIYSLSNDSEVVNNLVKKLNKNTSSYRKKPDAELLALILKITNKNNLLNDLEKELVEYRFLFDVLIQKYSIAHHLGYKIYTQTKDSNKNNGSKRNAKSSEAISIIDTTNKLADYKYRDQFRNSIYKSLEKTNAKFKKLSESRNLTEELYNLMFQNINVQIGIIYDLTELLNLLKLQYERDIEKKLNDYANLDLHEIEANLFARNAILKLKYLNSQILIYETISIHANYLHMIKFEVEDALRRSNKTWEVRFNEWVQLCLAKHQVIGESTTGIKEQKSKSIKEPSEPKVIKKPSEPSDEKLRVLSSKMTKAGIRIKEIVRQTNLDIQRKKKEAN